MASYDLSAVSQTGRRLRLFVASDPGRRATSRSEPRLRSLDSTDGAGSQPRANDDAAGRRWLRRRMDSRRRAVRVSDPHVDPAQAWTADEETAAAVLPPTDGANLRQETQTQAVSTALPGRNGLQRHQTSPRFVRQRLRILEPMPRPDAQGADAQYNAAQTKPGFRQSRSELFTAQAVISSDPFHLR